MSMSAIVVGAGIAGLTSAIALRKANFRVTVLEKKLVFREYGQALGVPSNAYRILVDLGIDLHKACPCVWKGLDIVKCANGSKECMVKQNNPVDQTSTSFFVHRVDFHQLLKEFAIQPDGIGPPVDIKSGCVVSSFDPENGVVVLHSGEKLQADLIVAADGITSTAHESVVGSTQPVIPTGMEVLRFTIPASFILGNPRTVSVLDGADKERAMLYVGSNSENVRLMRYPCRSGQLQNFGVYVVLNSLDGITTLASAESKMQLLSDCLGKIDSSLANMTELLSENDIYLWKIADREPLDHLVKGRMLVAGDAAHPMRQNLGQGASQAIEDAGVLGVVMQDVKAQGEIPRRLEIWEELRLKRVGSAQLLSRANLGGNPWSCSKDFELAERYIGKGNVPFQVEDLASYFLKGNVLDEAKQRMRTVNGV